jgi:hypothetical protein
MARARLLAVVLGAALFSSPAFAEPFKVQVDQTITLKLSKPADSVAVGNASIADVVVHDPTTLLVTGRAYGATNLVVLDRGGRQIYANQIAVGGAGSGELTIVRGGGTYTYSCVDKCRSTPTVGDVADHFDEVMSSANSKAVAGKGERQ